MSDHIDSQGLRKGTLRTALLAGREARGTCRTRVGANEAIAGQLRKVFALHPVSAIGFYWPVSGEFNACPVLTEWLMESESRQAALPVVVRPRAPMVFHAWHARSSMKEGRYRIPVPVEEEVVVPELLLVPCVGFDAERYRLGYGGGYYDRTLAAWPAAKRPITIGVAYEECKCGMLPREPHDLPLDAIVTDAAVY